MKKILFVLCLLATISQLQSQEIRKSIMQEELEYYNNLNLTNKTQFDSVTNFSGETTMPQNQRSCDLQKVVFGWNPYWMTSQYQNFQWNLISDFCFFSYEFNPNSGAVVNSRGFSTASSVTAAINNGKRVHLCVTLFENHAVFLANNTAQQTLITNLIAAVKQRNAKGINIDFEGVPSAEKVNFTNFMKSLSQRFHDSIPNGKVSICLPAVDWSNAYDVINMNNDAVASRNVDWFIIMGYDYYYGGSTTAGPTDPLYPFQATSTSCLSKTFTNYANKLPTSKIIMGLPNYGRQWQVTAPGIPATTVTGTGIARTYKQIKDNVNGFYSPANRIWNSDAFTECYQFQDLGNWYQCFVNNPYSWGRRLDMTLQRNYAGIGIWALGNDDGHTDLWDKISQKFTNCATVACTDSIFDMGGPNRNYFDNEQYSYTIQPTGATGLNLAFSEFQTESGFDTLFIYNGNSINAPLIGAYHGTNSPGIINASGNSLTIRFKSDGATNKTGWKATWNCSSDNIAPTSIINQIDSMWVTADYTSTFTDADNAGGSGVDRRFYQVMYFDGQEWTSNQNRGFVVDNFSLYNTAKWKIPAGNVSWNVANSQLQVLDTNTDNSNIYSALNGALSNTYLYDFYAKIDGTSTNKRFGFHFASDSASLSNRGNSYFIYIRPATNQLEFYKVVNNSFTQVKVVPNVITNLNQYYHYKIVHDRTTGKIEVFINDIFISDWTDPTPLTTPSKYFSFRSAKTQMWVKSMRVYRTRATSALVKVGTDADDDIQMQSSYSSLSAKIKSVVVDNTNNYSALMSKEMRVDWTKPILSSVNDGLSSDLAIFGSQGVIRGNWATAIDTNSGIQRYKYAVGTSLGGSNVVAWTDNALATNFEKTGLTFVDGTTYYISVKAQNGAGLWSDSLNSNGATFRLQPVADFNTNTQQICTGGSIQFTNLSANTTGQTWYFTGGTPATSTAVNPTISYATAGNYAVKLVVTGPSGADSVVRTSYISVQATPVIPTIVSNPTICQGSIAQLVASGSITLTWYSTLTGDNLLTTGTTLNTGNLNANTNFYVRSEIGTCFSPMKTFSVIVEPMPAAPLITPPTAICSGNLDTLFATGASTIKWYNSELGDNLLATGTSFITPVLTQNTTYFARVETVTCITSMSSVVVLVNSIPEVPTISQSQMCCYGDSLALNVSSENEVYWYHQEDEIIPFYMGNSYLTNSLFESDTLFVQSKMGDCYSNFVPIQIHVNSLPAAPIITLNGEEICSDLSTNLMWFFNENLIDTLLSACFIPVEDGIYSAQVFSAEGCISELSNSINFTHTSVGMIYHKGDFKILPNPASSDISILLEGDEPISSVTIFNTLGEVVVRTFTEKEKIDVSKLSKGVYFVEVTTESKMFVQKLLIIK